MDRCCQNTMTTEMISQNIYSKFDSHWIFHKWNQNVSLPNKHLQVLLLFLKSCEMKYE